MSSSNVSLFCWYNGTLTIDRDNNVMYVNGIVKPVIVRKPITMHELVEKVHQIIKISISEHYIHFTCM